MDSTNRKNAYLQKDLRFLLRGYIACWLLAFVAIKRDFSAALITEHFVRSWIFSGFSKFAFIWGLSLALFAILATLYYLVVRWSRS